MKALVSFVASLLLCASAAQAQSPDRQNPVAPPAAEAASTAAEAAAPAATAVVDVKARAVTAAEVGAVRLPAPAPAETPTDSDEAAQDITAPRNFWWLVGGIVLAGIILAVIL